MAFTTNNGVKIHWQEQGEGEPLLLIMGHLYTGDMWYPVLPELIKRYRVIWFDNRGVGQSGRSSKTTVSDLSGDARAVLDAAGVDKAHVFGVSMGGGIAMQLALESPERVLSLVLGCTAIAMATYARKPKSAYLAYFIPHFLMARGMRKADPAKSYGSACPLEAVEKDREILLAMKFSRFGVMEQAKAIASYQLTLDKAATITHQTLVLHGDEDNTVAYDRGVEIAQTLPNASLITYPGAGHNFVVAYTDKVLEDVTTFLDRVPAA